MMQILPSAWRLLHSSRVQQNCVYYNGNHAIGDYKTQNSKTWKNLSETNPNVDENQHSMKDSSSLQASQSRVPQICDACSSRINIAAASGRLIGSLAYILGLRPRDRSQRGETGQEIHGDRFSGPGDHSGPISIWLCRGVQVILQS